MAIRLIKGELIGNPRPGIYIYSVQIPDDIQPDEHIAVDFDEPIAVWQKCPICDGSGIVSGGYFQRCGDVAQWASSNAAETCRICGGAGIIKTPEEAT